MPYSVSKSDQCPASKPYAVLKEGGSVVPGGCHATREGALRHQKALVVNVSDAKAAALGRAEDARTKRETIRKI